MRHSEQDLVICPASCARRVWQLTSCTTSQNSSKDDLPLFELLWCSRKSRTTSDETSADATSLVRAKAFRSYSALFEAELSSPVIKFYMYVAAPVNIDAKSRRRLKTFALIIRECTSGASFFSSLRLHSSSVALLAASSSSSSTMIQWRVPTGGGPMAKLTIHTVLDYSFIFLIHRKIVGPCRVARTYRWTMPVLAEALTTLHLIRRTQPRRIMLPPTRRTMPTLNWPARGRL